MKDIPKSVRACLWSHDIAALDVQRDKSIIISNVLNYGTEEAARWVFRTYKEEEVANVLAHHAPGSMNKRSLALWSAALGRVFEPHTRVFG